MIYRVVLRSSTAEEAAIEVEADSQDEAVDLAVDRARDGMVAWTTTYEELETVDACPK